MKEKFKVEEESKKAVSKALDKVIHDENDFGKIENELENAGDNDNRDNFTMKFAFAV